MQKENKYTLQSREEGRQETVNTNQTDNEQLLEQIEGKHESIPLTAAQKLDAVLEKNYPEWVEFWDSFKKTKSKNI